MTQFGDRIRVALVGCGAVARQFYIPILAGHEGIDLVALVDRDTERARALAKRYGIARAEAEADQLDISWVDAALIATPPWHHAPCTIDLARRAIHVFVEKPMALSYPEAEAMVRAADEAGVVLAVGLSRRLFPRTRLLRAMMAEGLFGRPIGFDLEEGGMYRWPAATYDNMRRESAGGGTLIDIGSHAFDQLLFILPGRAEVLEYRDNTLGGIETDCIVKLRIHLDGHFVDGRIELSRTRALRNTIRIECERGIVEVPAYDRSYVRIRPDVKLVDAVTGAIRTYHLRAAWEDDLDGAPYHEGFRAAIDDWVDAIREGRPAQLRGASALQTVKLVDECYRRVQPLHEPAISEGLTRRAPEDAAVPTASPPTAASPWRPGRVFRRVLVTGGSGFIGGRVAEILALREGWEVRAFVHTPATVSRLSRLRVELWPGDVRSEADVNRAMEGCDAVVHCAMGTDWGNRRQIFAVNADGTRNLAAAALAAGVRRFVHLSTIAVHGYRVTRILDESTPVAPAKGDVYSESKAAAENVLAHTVRDGLNAIILRPAHVYGPFSPLFGTSLFQDLARGHLKLGDSANTLSNAVYVDNVVDAIVLSMKASEHVGGEAFAIGDGDEQTWREFYTYFADALGVQIRIDSSGSGGLGRTSPGRGLRDWYRSCVEVATSKEARALGRRVLQTDPLGRFAQRILESSPSLRKLLKVGEAAGRVEIYRRPPATQDGDGEVGEFRIQFPLVSVEKARRVLGYTPLPKTLTMPRTLDWLRYARLLGGRQSDT
jgi:predicted dehydrogenase/nucleoside-diphosphate-sugar epimerase